MHLYVYGNTDKTCDAVTGEDEVKLGILQHMTLTLGKGSCVVRVTGPIAETQWRLIADYSRITATAPAMLTANPTSCAAEAGCDRRIRAVMSYAMMLLARPRLVSSRVRRTQSRSFTTLTGAALSRLQ